MAMTLARAVEETVNLIYGNTEVDDGETKYVRDPVRIEEAAQIEPVAEAFARAEIEPRDKGLGTFGGTMVPPVGHQLRRKLDRGGEDAREAVSDGIKQALAAGYVGFMSIEPQAGVNFVSGTEHALAWKLVVHNFRGEGLRGLGFAREFCDRAERIAEDALRARLRSAGLIGFRSGRVGLVGRYYGDAGGWMRAAQTDLETPAKAALLTAVEADRWPYEQYATIT